MKKIYVGDENKPVKGKIKGIRGIERQEGFFIFMFSNNALADEAMRVFITSGYELVGEEVEDVEGCKD